MPKGGVAMKGMHKKGAPKGSHRMPDGTIMKDSMMKAMMGGKGKKPAGKSGKKGY